MAKRTLRPREPWGRYESRFTQCKQSMCTAILQGKGAACIPCCRSGAASAAAARIITTEHRAEGQQALSTRSACAFQGMRSRGHGNAPAACVTSAPSKMAARNARQRGACIRPRAAASHRASTSYRRSLLQTGCGRHCNNAQSRPPCRPLPGQCFVGLAVACKADLLLHVHAVLGGARLCTQRAQQAVVLQAQKGAAGRQGRRRPGQAPACRNATCCNASLYEPYSSTPC